MYRGGVRSVLCFLWVVGWTSSAFAEGPAAAPVEAAERPGADVKLHDTVVFRVWRDQGQRTAADRARTARTALEEALKAHRTDVRVVVQGPAQVLYVGEGPVIELYAEDAKAAGDASLDVHSARLVARTKAVLRVERDRGELADTVLAISLVVLFGLVALYVLRMIGEWTERARRHLAEHPDAIAAIRVQSLEVIGAAPLRGAFLAALIVGRWVAWIGVIYVWLVAAFGQFEATRPYTEQLTSFVATPLSVLAGRLLSALPLGILAVVFAAIVYVVLRFVEQFFLSASQSEARLTSIPADLLLPTSLLVRAGIVLLVLVFAGPVITGDSQSGLARVGAGALAATALAATPLLSSVVVGIVLVFTRRVRVGEDVTIGGHTGRIVSLNLFDVQLRAADGAEVRVPHLLALVRPIAQHAPNLRSTVQICVSLASPLEASRDLLLQCAGAHGESAHVELSHVDADGALFTISVRSGEAHAEHRLRLAVAQAVLAAGIQLGRAARASGGPGP